VQDAGTIGEGKARVRDTHKHDRELSGKQVVLVGLGRKRVRDYIGGVKDIRSDARGQRM
jgi:hypothetical protein